MFIELVNGTLQMRQEFAENVRDAFGRDLDYTFLEPLLGELAELARLEDDIRQQMANTDTILAEIRNITPIA